MGLKRFLSRSLCVSCRNGPFCLNSLSALNPTGLPTALNVFWRQNTAHCWPCTIQLTSRSYYVINLRFTVIAQYYATRTHINAKNCYKRLLQPYSTTVLTKMNHSFFGAKSSLSARRKRPLLLLLLCTTRIRRTSSSNLYIDVCQCVDLAPKMLAHKLIELPALCIFVR